MEKFWSFRAGLGNYDFRRLINTRILENTQNKPLHIVCDIDKTYLETNITGTLQMLRIAFEEPEDKITVPGASLFLKLLRWENPYEPMPESSKNLLPRPLHFVSASPPQLRKVLDEKLCLDGLNWSSDSFKNQAYNIRKGRLDLLRHHVAYKTATTLNIIEEAPDNSECILIGDNAEYDAYIYFGLAAYLDGKLNSSQYLDYLIIGGVQKEVAEDFKSSLKRNKNSRIRLILIRQAPKHYLPLHPPITDYINQFEQYFIAYCLMLRKGLICHDSLEKAVREFHNRSGYALPEIASVLGQLADDIKSESLERTLNLVKTLIKDLGLKQAGGKETMKLVEAKNLEDIALTGDDLLHEVKKWVQLLTQDYATK